MSVTDRVEGLVAPLCDRLGAELLDVEYAGGTLSLTVDHPDGVGMDVIAELTREVSRMLDHEDPVHGSYTLEVSSPGLERPLKRAGHFLRALGDTVNVKTQPGTQGDRRFGGVLEAADDHEVVVRLDDGSTRTVRYDEILKAHTVFDWKPEPKSARKGADPATAGSGAPTTREVGR